MECEMSMIGELTFFHGLQINQTVNVYLLTNSNMLKMYLKNSVWAPPNHVLPLWIPLKKLIKIIILHLLARRDIEVWLVEFYI